MAGTIHRRAAEEVKVGVAAGGDGSHRLQLA
jgi:hypothetical protein